MTSSRLFPSARPLGRILAAAAALLLILTACTPASPSSLPDSGSPESSAPEVWDPVPQEVAALGDKDTDVDILVSLDDQVTRDDLGITVEIAPVDFRRYIQVLAALELRPLEEGDPPLDIPKPFTLAFSWQGKEYSYAFSSQKIVANGADAYPANPAALEELYEYEKEGYEGLLTQDIYYLREDMDFAPEDIVSVELVSLSGSDEDRLVTTGPDDIRKAFDSLGALVVWKMDPESPPNPKTGGASSCIFTFGDGTVWKYETALPRCIDRLGNEVLYGEVSLNYGSLFDPLHDGSQVGVSLYATMSGLSLPVSQSELDYQGIKKTWSSSMEEIFPSSLYYETDPVITPGSDTSCVLAFRDSQGQGVTPTSVSVSLWQEDPDSFTMAAVTAPGLSGNTLELPGERGKYCVRLDAEFPGGSGSYFFEYRVTDLPDYFDDISYGNLEGDVTFTRTDAQLTVPGGPNRQYISFIRSLGLALAEEGEAPTQPLEIREPFSMTFHHENETCTFAFSAQGVTLDGKPCVLDHPERIADLYIPLTAENAMLADDGMVDYALRGFLTKEVASFSQAFPLSGDQVEAVVVTAERPKEYTDYDVTASLNGDLSWFDTVILAREWSDGDYYWPRRFFLSYRITLEDGTVYQLGEQLLKDGQPTGWYAVYTDLPEVQALLDTLEGQPVQREEPLRTALSIDDAGNISFS